MTQDLPTARREDPASGSPRAERFVLASLGLVLVSNCASLFNFLFQWIAAHHLSPSDYGSLGALLALITYLSMPGQAIQLVAARRGSQALSRGGVSQLPILQRALLRYVIVFAVVFAGIATCGAPLLRDAFHFSSTTEPLLAVAVAVVSLFFFLSLGVLQAGQRFRRFGLCHAALAAGKLTLGGGAAALGAGLKTIAVTLIVAPSAIALSLLRTRASAPPTDGAPLTDGVADVAVPTPRSFLREGIPIALTFGGFAAFLHLDIGFVQHYYGGDERPYAGVYNAACTLGRAALHIPTAITAVTFAGVSRAAAEGRDTRPYLYKSLAIHCVLSIAVVVPVGFFAPHLLELYAGDDRYVAAAPLLRVYLLPMVLLGVVSIFINDSFARDRRQAGWIVGVGIVVLIALFSRPPDVAATTGADATWIVTRLTWVSIAMVSIFLFGLARRSPSRIAAQARPGDQES